MGYLVLNEMLSYIQITGIIIIIIIIIVIVIFTPNIIINKNIIIYN